MACNNSLPQTPCDCKLKIGVLNEDLSELDREFEVFGPDLKKHYKESLDRLMAKATELNKLSEHCRKLYKEKQDECNAIDPIQSLWDCGEYIVDHRQMYADKYSGNWARDSAKFTASRTYPESSLESYLNREQYGSWPILYGKYGDWTKEDSLKNDSILQIYKAENKRVFPKMWRVKPKWYKNEPNSRKDR